MTGMIVGGWEYVRAAYSVTALLLTAYSLSVIVRYRAALRRQKRTEGTANGE